MSDVPFLRWIKDWWHVIGGCILLILAVGETRWQVNELMNRKTAETEQWRRINANEDRSKENGGRLVVIEKHVTVEAVQEWGALKQQFREDHEDLQEHLRNHP